MKKRVATVFICMLLVFLGKGLYHYSGFYRPPEGKIPGLEFIPPPEPSITSPESVSQEQKGTILIDTAHRNNFRDDELNVLIQRIIARGLTPKFFTDKDELKKALGREEKKAGGEKTPSDEKEKPSDEKEKPPAIALIVALPREEFTSEDKKTIRDFVDTGGRLLLIADPTRPSEVNSLALDFGLLFEGDYLYNMKENESNYRHIFVTEFKDTDVTKEVKKIALYTAGSITSAKDGIAFTDENTFSSRIETRKKLSPIALTHENNVLALYDLTFMTEPYNGIQDNNRLISNIVSWLASAAPKPVEKK